MARERLTSKTAEDWMKSKPGTQVEDKGTGIDNDPSSMNNPDHEKNDPKVDAYAKGDPSAWAEDVDKSNLWKKDKRDEMHVPEMTSKQAAEAVAAAKKLEEKAIKCIVASQRMLPGASDDLIEAQAADLMHLPENCVNATLSRQEDLAKLISKAANDSAEESDEESDEDEESEKKPEEESDEEKEEKDAGDIPEGLKKFQEEQKGKKPEGDEPEGDMDKVANAIISGDISKLPPALQKHIQDMKDKKNDKDVDAAAKNPEEEDEEEVDAAKEEKNPEEGDMSCEASETSILDEIFSSVTASDSKKGAKTLKGMVKKEASEGGNGLNGIWDSPPDVSGVFK